MTDLDEETWAAMKVAAKLTGKRFAFMCTPNDELWFYDTRFDEERRRELSYYEKISQHDLNIAIEAMKFGAYFRQG